MKIILLLSLLLAIASCEQEKEYDLDAVKAELDSINISEIESACDCSDGMEKITNILYKSTERFSTKDEVMKDSVGSQIATLTTNKTLEVANKCGEELGITDADILGCESFKSFEKTSKILNEKFRN